MRSEDTLAQERNPTGLKILRLMWTIGASGAISSKKGQGLDDVTPPVRTAAGKYTLTLDKACKGIVQFSGGVKQATGVAPLSVVHTTGDGTSTTVTIETRVAAGTPTDPANGDIVYLMCVIDELGLYK